MRIDCHTHTSHYSACSHLRPAELCSLARERGLDGIVLTEHRVQWPQPDVEQMRLRFPDLTVYSGVEVSTREGYDVVLIADEIRLRLPDFPTAGHLQRLLEDCREEVFSFVAHPFRYRNIMTADLQRILQVVEGIEMNSMNILKGGPEEFEDGFAPVNLDMYIQAQQDFGLIPVYNSDTHAPESVGTIATELPGNEPPPDAAGLARLLRQGKGRQWQNTQQVERFLDRIYLF